MHHLILPFFSLFSLFSLFHFYMFSLGSLFRFSKPCQAKVINQTFRYISQEAQKNKPSNQGQKSKTVSKSPQKLQIISAVIIPQKTEKNKTTENKSKCCSLCNQEFTTSFKHPLSNESKGKLADGSSICAGCKM